MYEEAHSFLCRIIWVLLSTSSPNRQALATIGMEERLRESRGTEHTGVIYCTAEDGRLLDPNKTTAKKTVGLFNYSFCGAYLNGKE